MAKLSAALASEVAALAASAAQKQPKVRGSKDKTGGKGGTGGARMQPDPEHEKRSERGPASARAKGGAGGEGVRGVGQEAAGAAPVFSDQTKVVVSGLPANARAEDIEDAFSDAGPVRHIKVAKNGKATVHFVLAADAVRCVKELQGLELEGQPLKLALGESAEAAAASGGSTAPSSDKPAPQYTKLNTRLFRLVIRNLPFGIKEAAVRSAFEAFGTLEEVHLPVKKGADGSMQTRGFGFLQYSARIEAKKALDEGNGMKLLGRPVAVDWAVAKEIYQEMVPAKKGAEKGGDGEGGKDASEKKRKEREDGDSKPGGQIGAVEKKTKGNGDQAAVDKETELGRTVFIRNIPLEAEEQELREVMRRFGKLVYCKLVIDKVRMGIRVCVERAHGGRAGGRAALCVVLACVCARARARVLEWWCIC